MWLYITLHKALVAGIQVSCIRQTSTYRMQRGPESSVSSVPMTLCTPPTTLCRVCDSSVVLIASLHICATETTRHQMLTHQTSTTLQSKKCQYCAFAYCTSPHACLPCACAAKSTAVAIHRRVSTTRPVGDASDTILPYAHNLVNPYDESSALTVHAAYCSTYLAGG